MTFPGRVWAVSVACRGMALAGLVGAVGDALQYLDSGTPLVLAASLAAFAQTLLHLAILWAFARGHGWAERVLFGTSAFWVVFVALLQTEPGTFLYLSFGGTYLATLAFVVSDRPIRLQIAASLLFPAALLLRHQLRPMPSLANPVELLTVAVCGAVAVGALSSWVQGVLREYATALDTSEHGQVQLQALNRELALARDAALEAGRAKDRFLANMSHELRTPLNAIVGFTELLVEDPDVDRSQLVTDLGAIHTSSIHLLGLVSAVLDLARIGEGGIALHLGPVQLRPLLEEIADTARGLVTAGGNTFLLDLDLAVDPIVSDGEKLRRILLNLLGNAAKFTRSGAIVLRVRTGPDGLSAEVRDTGIGIPADRLEDVFERFVQVDGSSTRIHGGAGLGLSLVRELSVLLGGAVTVQSELGAGSVFLLRIPAERIAPPGPTGQPGEAP